LLPTGSHFLSTTALMGSSALSRFIWVLAHDVYSAIPIPHCGLRGWRHVQSGGGPNLARFRDRIRTLSQKRHFSSWAV
jgi:hypothetical protein